MKSNLKSAQKSAQKRQIAEKSSQKSEICSKKYSKKELYSKKYSKKWVAQKSNWQENIGFHTLTGRKRTNLMNDGRKH